MSSLPPVPMIDPADPGAIQAVLVWLNDMRDGFDNAVGQAMDPTTTGFKAGEDSQRPGSLTIQSVPTGIQYAGTVQGNAADGTIFGAIDFIFTLPSRAVEVAAFYRELGEANFKPSYFNTSPARVINLKPGVTYEVQLAGVAANGAFGPKSTLTQVAIGTTLGVPATPTGLAAVPQQAEIVLTWNAPLDATVKSHEVQRADDAAFTVNVVTTARIRTNYYVDQFTGKDRTYYYRIRALRDTGEASAYTASVTATTSGIATTDIQTGAVSAADDDYVAGDLSVTNATETILSTATLTTNGGVVMLMGSAEADLLGSEGLTLRIRRDDLAGAVLGGPVTTSLPAAATIDAGTAVIGLDTAPVGGETYVLTGYVTGAAPRNVRQRRLVAVNLKV